ncbi:MAG TPA: lipid II flippase MurJ, partial [Acetobacteraceae bacterium]|nr:lipid II flippase MurJ [Acetobacteraceae bacterium]
DTKTPVLVGLAALFVNLVFILTLMGPLGATGIASAASISATFNTGVLAAILVRRGALRADRGLRSRAPRMLLAAAAMGLALALASEGVPEGAGVLRWMRLGVIIAAGVLVYGLAGQALAAFDLREIAGRLARRRRRA